MVYSSKAVANKLFYAFINIEHGKQKQKYYYDHD